MIGRKTCPQGQVFLCLILFQKAGLTWTLQKLFQKPLLTTNQINTYEPLRLFTAYQPDKHS